MRVCLDGAASGESLSTVQPPESRSRRYNFRGVILDGAATGEPFLTDHPPERLFDIGSHGSSIVGVDICMSKLGSSVLIYVCRN